MINLEQVKLLETKVVKTIDYVERLVKENAALHRQEAELQAKLGSYQKRIDELEVLVTRFKEDQSQIENSFFAALDKLNQFEKAMEKSLRATKAAVKEPAKVAHGNAAQPDAAVTETAGDSGSGDGQTCFEIPEGADEDDIPDPLENIPDKKSPANTGNAPAEGGELDIF